MDAVNSPTHYTNGRIETIYTIEHVLGPEGFKAYCMGNWIKYNARHKHKGGAEDLAKAEKYLEWATKGLPEPVNGKVPTQTKHRARFKVGDYIKCESSDSVSYAMVDAIVNHSYRVSVVDKVGVGDYKLCGISYFIPIDSVHWVLDR